MDGLRFFGCSLVEIQRMGVAEYLLRMKAQHLRFVDEMEEYVVQAFVHRAVHATKKGKYIVKKPGDIYDAEKERKKILNPEGRIGSYDRLMQITRNVEQYRKEVGE